MKLERFTRVLGLWSCTLAAGTWMIPVLAIGPVSPQACAAPHMPGDEDNGSAEAGGWVWKEGAGIAEATEKLWNEAAGVAPVPGMLLTLDEVGGSPLLRSVSIDGARAASEWSTAIGRSASFSSGAEVATSLVQTADGIPGVQTVSVDAAAVLLELPALGTGISLLGVQVLIEQELQLQTGETQSTQVNAVLPLEFGLPFESESGPHLALAQVLTNSTTDAHGPTYYPVLYPAPLSIDCTNVTGGSLGCLCNCWRTWHAQRASFDQGLWIAIHACKWLIAGTLLGCGAVCVLTVPSGGGAAPACIACLRWLGGEALSCVLGALASYAASAETFRFKRQRCIGECSGLMNGWEHIEGTVTAID